MKKDLTEAEAQHIAHQLAERKRPTAVYLSGKRLSKSKVERAIRRHTHPRISSRYISGKCLYILCLEFECNLLIISVLRIPSYPL